MKLSKCTHGKLVVTDDEEVGMVVGVTYNIPLIQCGNMSYKELLGRTIPLVQFPAGTRGVHHGNLELFKD